MNLGNMIIFAAILSFMAVAVLSINSEFLQQTNSTAVESSNIESLSIVNKSVATKELLKKSSAAVSKTTVSGQTADALVNPVGAFTAALTIFTDMPGIIMGFASDIGQILKLPPWLTGTNGLIAVIVMVLLIGGMLTLIFKVNIFR